MTGQVSAVESLAAVVNRIEPLDSSAMDAAAAGLDRLTKPPGSLGRLEELVIALAGITGRADAAVARRAIVVTAGVTPQMGSNFVAGGAAINALAAAAGAAVHVVDVGVALPIPRIRREPRRGAHLVRARIANGTADFTEGPAMSRDDAVRAVAVGLELVERFRTSGGFDVLGVGEMGIGNTTSASALVAALTGEAVARVTGRGTGIDGPAMARKIAVIERGLAHNQPDPSDPIGVLAALGGFEIAALVGLILGAAAAHVPVILDGFITGAAALVAAAIQPALPPRLIAAHQSAEPGHAIVLERLGLRPYLQLDLRLGEGSGAALGIGLLVAACRVRDEMATFESADVSGPAQPPPARAGATDS